MKSTKKANYIPSNFTTPHNMYGQQNNSKSPAKSLSILAAQKPSSNLSKPKCTRVIPCHLGHLQWKVVSSLRFASKKLNTIYHVYIQIYKASDWVTVVGSNPLWRHIIKVSILSSEVLSFYWHTEKYP